MSPDQFMHDFHLCLYSAAGGFVVGQVVAYCFARRITKQAVGKILRRYRREP